MNMRSNAKFWFVCLSVAGAALSVWAHTSAGSELSTYFPLNDGDQKSFIYPKNQSVTLVTAATSGNTYTMTETTPIGSASLSLDVEGSDIMLSDLSDSLVDLSLDPEIVMIDEAILTRGGVVRSKSTVTQSGLGNISYPATFTVRIANAGTVRVPAGVFRGCRSFSSGEVAKVPHHGTIHASALTGYLAPGVGIIKLLVTRGHWAVLESGTVGGNPVTAMAPADFAGSYTMRLDSAAAGSTNGIGYATMTVGASGGVSIAGRLADGQSFSAAAQRAGNRVTISKSLAYSQAARGSLSGTLTFNAVPDPAEVTGTLEWVKPAEIQGANAAAIHATLNVAGCTYNPPAGGGTALLGFTSGSLSVTGSAGVLFNEAVTLNADNTFAVEGANPENLSIKLSPSTGVIHGTFTIPGHRRPASFSGALLQDETGAAGFFISPDTAGAVSLSPR